MTKMVSQMDSNLCKNLVIENGRRSLARFLQPLQDMAGLQLDLLGSFVVNGESYSLPRFTFQGPNSSEPIRIGIFSAIHGDEPAGALASMQFLLDLVNDPPLAENFLLQV